MKKKVGLIGFGLIGQYLYRKLNAEPWANCVSFMTLIHAQQHPFQLIFWPTK